MFCIIFAYIGLKISTNRVFLFILNFYLSFGSCCWLSSKWSRCLWISFGIYGQCGCSCLWWNSYFSCRACCFLESVQAFVSYVSIGNTFFICITRIRFTWVFWKKKRFNTSLNSQAPESNLLTGIVSKHLKPTIFALFY